MDPTVALPPQEDVKGTWQACSPQTVGPFSAVAYFFGRQLHRELGVPVGLINSSWGGTIIEAWTDRASLEAAGLETQRLADLDRAREHLPELQAGQRAATEAVVRELANDSLAAPGLADGDWATLSAAPGGRRRDDVGHLRPAVQEEIILRREHEL